MHMKFNFYAVAAFLFLALAARAQTTAFTYQGQLNSSNAPATGSYDFRFQIYNANNSVVAGPLTNAPVGVTNGLFTVTLDFGASVFDGSTRSLEIGVRSFIASNNNGNTNAYTVLSPRQTLTSVPYAIQSLNALASNAVALTAPLPATNLDRDDSELAAFPNVAVLTNNVIFSGNVTTSLVGNFTGNGSGLTNVPATSLIGTIARCAAVHERGVAKQSQLEFRRLRFRHQLHRGRPRADQRAGRVLLGDGAVTNYQIYAQCRLYRHQQHRAGDIDAASVAQCRRCV
jgi:hypothetical protein